MRNVWNLVVRLMKPEVTAREITAALFVIGLFGAGIGGLTSSSAVAKTPGKTYCFDGVCHRVLTLAETQRRVGTREKAVASFYDDCRRDRNNPCGLTSSGAVFRPGAADNAASPIYPNGTKLLVFNPRNRKAAVVRVNNAGPYSGRRTLDLSRAAAEKLGFRNSGVARLVVQVIKAPSAQEARYKRRRRYAPVKGYLGQFDDVGEALAAAGYAARVMTAMMGADPSWAAYAAKATPVLPVKVALAPAPLPEKPAPQFREKIRALAKAARHRRLVRERRDEARRIARARAIAAEKASAEERRRVAAAAQKEKAVAQRKAADRKAEPAQRRVASTKPTPGNASAARQGAPRAGAAQQAAEEQPRKPRTVWRREIVGVAQNAS
jgi:rare lipoprotein A